MRLKEDGQSEWEQLPESHGGFRPALQSALGGLVAAAGVVLILAASVVLGLQDQSLVAGAISTATASVTPSPLPATRPPDMSARLPLRPSPTRSLVTPTATAPPWSSPTPTPLPSPATVPLTATPTASPSATPVPPTATPSASPSATPTRSAWTSQTDRSTPANATRTPCAPNPPQGWQRYTVKRGETLSRIAARFGVSAQQLMTVNCLSRASVRAQQELWVPYVVPTTES